MNQVMLDTSAYSAFMRARPQAVAVVQAADRICVNPVVLGELTAGFLRGERLSENRRELLSFLSSPRAIVVDIDSDTAERYAVILASLLAAGTPIPTNDIWIAASAMQHGFRIVTADKHFRRISQVLVDLLE